LLAMALVRCLRRLRSDDNDLFLTAFTWPVLLPLLAAMTRFQDAEQHWTMMALVPAAIAAGRYADDTLPWARPARILGICGIVVSGLLFLVANVHARTPALLRLVPRDQYDPRADMINELIGWDKVRASVAEAVAAARSPVVLAGNQYAFCGRLLFEMGDSPPVYCPTERRSAYDFFDRRDPPPDATVIALTTDIHPQLPAALLGRSCVRTDEVDIDRDGRNVARYFLQSCAPVSPDHGTDLASLGRR
jgi:hypothetical protein